MDGTADQVVWRGVWVDCDTKELDRLHGWVHEVVVQLLEAPPDLKAYDVVASEVGRHGKVALQSEPGRGVSPVTQVGDQGVLSRERLRRVTDDLRDDTSVTGEPNGADAGTPLGDSADVYLLDRQEGTIDHEVDHVLGGGTGSLNGRYGVAGELLQQ